jgi:hypothetical protein
MDSKVASLLLVAAVLLLTISCRLQSDVKSSSLGAQFPSPMSPDLGSAAGGQSTTADRKTPKSMDTSTDSASSAATQSSGDERKGATTADSEKEKEEVERDRFHAPGEAVYLAVIKQTFTDR